MGELQIEQDLEFQNRTWSAQRVGWIIMALLVLAALLGVFGKGMLSSASAENGSLRLEYERFGRFQAPMNLRLHWNSGSQVLVSRKYLESVQIEQITPEPNRVEAGDRWLTYMFTRSGQEPSSVTFHLKAQKIGLLKGSVQLKEGASLSFKQFIYP